MIIVSQVLSAFIQTSANMTELKIVTYRKSGCVVTANLSVTQEH